MQFYIDFCSYNTESLITIIQIDQRSIKHENCFHCIQIQWIVEQKCVI